MKNLGSLKNFLGIKVPCSEQGMYLCQRKYVMDIFSNAHLLGDKPLDFSMEHNIS